MARQSIVRSLREQLAEIESALLTATTSEEKTLHRMHQAVETQLDSFSKREPRQCAIS